MQKRVSLEKKKAALYIRVSTRYQIDGDSLPMQRDELPKYVKYALDIDDYEVFEDAGYSAKNTDRPAYQRMMARCRASEFSHIVVWKLDRISRNLLDFAEMYAELKKRGITFISKNEQFDTSTSFGEAMLKIILVFAELERNMTSERVTATMISRAQSGQWNGGRIPFGYDYDKQTTLFSLNEKEHATVQRMNNEYEERSSLLKVARLLNSLSLFPRSGNPWTPATVCAILRNPFYVGDYYYNKKKDTTGKTGIKNKEEDWVYIKDHHPAAISREQFQRVNKMLDDKGKTSAFKTYDRKNVHVFAGLITCSMCGAHYQATIDVQRTYVKGRQSIYLCGTRRKTNGCQNKYVTDFNIGPVILNFLANYIRAQRSFGRSTTTSTLEKKLLRGNCFEGIHLAPESVEMLHRFLRDTKFGLNEFQGTGDDQQPSIDEREILEDERRRLERAIQRLKTLYLYSEDSMSEKQFIEENNALVADLNRVSSRLDELNETEGSFDGEYIPDSMFERASYVLISEELLSNRYVDYEELKQAVDRRVLKKFINMSLTNICVKNGKIESLTLKNGIEIRFTYQEL